MAPLTVTTLVEAIGLFILFIIRGTNVVIQFLSVRMILGVRFLREFGLTTEVAK